MQKRILCYAVACLLSVSLFGQVTTTVTSNNQLWDLRLDNATDMSASDDGTSQVFNFGFDFNFFGETFNQGYMASNGCLILGSLSTVDTWEKNCTQYNPSPSPNTNYTMYPFWTDLIMGENSSMLAKSFDDKIIFGWYEMWEYYRDSKNTFELWLYPNNTYEAIYGQLDIQDHDVFIGIQGNEKELETYYFHDECNTGIINSTTCVNQDWNNIGENQTLENGGSIFVGEAADCSNPLNDTSCSGYADAYQTQQCNIDQLYSESCPYYWDAYDDLQCNLDPQYGPFCQGYSQENDVAYFQEDQFNYGYEEEEQLGYEEEPMFEEYVYEFEEQNNGEQELTFEEEIIFEQMFPQEEFHDPFVSVHDTPLRDEEIFTPTDDLMVEEFIFQETFLVEDYREPETFIELETIDQLEEWFEEETRREEEIAILEEPEEEFVEEIFEEEVVEEVFEAIEERMAEAEIEEERIEREEIIEEDVFEEEFEVAERENAKGESSISREIALKIVSATITTATNSISGTDSGSSVHATGGSLASGNVFASSSNTSMSISSSPSISDQFASSTAQTNQVLDMSSMSVSNSSFSSTAVETETTTEVAVATVTTETTQDQMDTSIASVESDSETTVENIIAQNLQMAQEQVIAKQEETGEYGSENAIIAVMGFLPNFNNYRLVSIPQKEFWYKPKNIYTNNKLSDNTEAFYSMAGQSIKTLTDLKNMQPTL